MAQDEALPHWRSSCKQVTGDFLSVFGFTVLLQCWWGCVSERRIAARRGWWCCCNAAPFLPHRPLFKNWRFYCFIAVCVRGNFCLARFSIPNRWDEDKGTQEEVEQKLMSVSAVQCVSSWLGQPMNKSKFLFLSPPLFSLPPSFLLSF